MLAALGQVLCLSLSPLLRWTFITWFVYISFATHYHGTNAPSLAGLFASRDCSGPNLLEGLGLPPGLNLRAAARTSCHHSRFCGGAGAARHSLNATFFNDSFLALQGVAGTNCSSGNVTYSAGVHLPLPSTDGGLAGCLAHASGSALFLRNFHDPEAPPLPEARLSSRVLVFLLQRPWSFFFVLLGLLAAMGRRVELVDGAKVELEPWEAARAASASRVYLAAALALLGASQALYAADFFEEAVYADECALQATAWPYYWFWVSLAVDLAALLALVVHLQLARLARDCYCFGGSVSSVLPIFLHLARTQEPRATPLWRPHRTPCTVSTSATALVLALGAALSMATSLGPALAQPAGAQEATSRALALAGTGALCCALALLAWGCWAARGVTGVGCQRGLLLAHQSEPPRYVTPQSLYEEEIAAARLLAALERWRGGGRCGGGGGGSEGRAGGGQAPPQLYLLHLCPLDTQARLAACLECWKAGRPCPGTGGPEGGAHSLHHTCGICLDSTRADRQWMALACAHLFHAQCIMQWVRVAHGSRTAVACPLDQICVTRRPRQARNSWSPSAEASGEFWIEHAAEGGAGGSASASASASGGSRRVLPVHGARYYSSGSRHVSELPRGAIVMAPVLEEEEEGEEAGGGEGAEEGAAAAVPVAPEEADPSAAPEAGAAAAALGGAAAFAGGAAHLPTVARPPTRERA